MSKGRKLLPPPGLEGLREEAPPSGAEPRSLAAVRVGTIEHMSRCYRLVLSFHACDSVLPPALCSSTSDSALIVPTNKTVKSETEVAQSCPTLSDPMDCSLPGSSFHGIFQARVLEWGAIAFSQRLVFTMEF